jgi:hypothetical protein
MNLLGWAVVLLFASIIAVLIERRNRELKAQG